LQILIELIGDSLQAVSRHFGAAGFFANALAQTERTLIRLFVCVARQLRALFGGPNLCPNISPPKEFRTVRRLA